MTDSVTVETSAGRVSGVRKGAVWAFRGIPYGADTGMAGRFQAPGPVPAWTGVRECNAFGATAVQLRPRLDSERAPERPAERTGEPFSEFGLSMSEDCLVLNVWTPATSGKRPVMVWLHGGGFSVGSGSSPLYWGGKLAERGDAVVITLNHRLGLLGFMQLEDRFGERYSGSGNAGILDLVAALQWVKANAERFGGDPQCVTIFGESGGGGKVSALLASPAARGLFHRAVVQSGPPFQFPDRPTSAEVTDKALALLGIAPGDGPDRLHQLPAEELLRVQVALGAGGGPSPGGMSFAPTVDGHVLFDWPEPAVARGASADVPLLIGTNLDEARFMMMMNPQLRKSPPELSDAELIERASPGCDHGTEALLAHYRKQYPALSSFDLLLKVESEQFRIRSIRLAEHKLIGAQAPVFMYLFTWTTPRLARYGAYHGLEIPFLFDTLQTSPHVAADPEAGAMVERMQRSWVEFARTGRPGGEGLPGWEPYRTQDRSTMVIDREWSLQRDPFGDDRQAWDDVPTGPTTRPWSRVVA